MRVLKKIATALGYIVLSIAVLAGAAVSFLYIKKPAQRPASKINIEATPARLARGEYLWYLGDCDGCHSPHDEKTFAVLPGNRGQGNMIRFGANAYFSIPNVTPDKETGIGTWTDGEKIRAVREGVDKDGNALLPLMPYKDFRYMSDEDAMSLVAYMGTLKPVRNPTPRTQFPWYAKLAMKLAPKPLKQPVASVDPADKRLQGEYLVTIAHCAECHDRTFAGGHKMELYGHVVYSANISPDKETGIGTWTLEYFRERFYRHKDAPPQRFTLMPWQQFSHLTANDLETIYTYLHSRPPVGNRVNPFGEEQLAQAR